MSQAIYSVLLNRMLRGSPQKQRTFLLYAIQGAFEQWHSKQKYGLLWNNFNESMLAPRRFCCCPPTGVQSFVENGCVTFANYA